MDDKTNQVIANHGDNGQRVADVTARAGVAGYDTEVGDAETENRANEVDENDE